MKTTEAILDTQKLDMHVLYVEDEDGVREALARIMVRKVKSITAVPNGKVALDEFKLKKPDLVITDIKMPIMDGLRLAEEIKKLSPETPVVISTAFTDIEHFIKAIEIGVDKFLVKPVNIEKLTNLLTEYDLIIKNTKELIKNRKLLEEYKKAVDASAIISKTDKNGVITFVNDAYCELSGYSREELIGSKHELIRHPNTPKTVFEAMWETINSKLIWHGIIENRKKDGSSYFVDQRIIPILDENDEIVEFIDFQYDITELILKEQELERIRIEQMKENIERATDIRLETLLKNIPLPSVIIDENNIVLFANKRFENLFDIYNDTEIIKKLKDGELNIKSILMLEDGANFESMFDWKEIVAEIGDETHTVVRLKKEDESKRFQISIQRIETIATKKRFVLCLSDCVKK